MANQEEINLKWNGYQSNILNTLKGLFKDEGLSDVTLVSGGHSFKAHKVILSANSSVFRTIFQQNPQKDPIILLHDINTESLRTLLTYMYYGDVNVKEEFLPVLLKTAEQLKICGLSTDDEEDESLSDTCPQEDEVTTTYQHKKRKKSGHEDNNNKVKKSTPSLPTPDPQNENVDALNIPNIALKEEPNDAQITDYTGGIINDTNTLLEEVVEMEYTVIPESENTSVCTTITEVTNTVPCLNSRKNNQVDDLEKERDSIDIDIDKEVETVLLSGTITESLSSVSSGAQNSSDKKNTSSFPCPFCPRVYNSWGFRKRHVKSWHSANRLSCKKCSSVLNSTSAWHEHATRAHRVSHEEARNALVVMAEACWVPRIHKGTLRFWAKTT